MMLTRNVGVASFHNMRTFGKPLARNSGPGPLAEIGGKNDLLVTPDSILAAHKIFHEICHAPNAPVTRV